MATVTFCRVSRLARRLRLTRRRTVDWKAAQEATATLRRFDPEDPVRFDFALCHVGMMGACGYGDRQRDARHAVVDRRAAAG